MNKNTYLIESIAPLVFRSGKPFGSQASGQDIIFPLPSASAGLIRALTIEQTVGQYKNYEKKLKDEDYQKLLSIRTQGPFLVQFDTEKPDDYTILLPKPANALYFEDKDTQKIHLVRLEPKELDYDVCGTDLPQGLLPIQMKKQLKGKPKSGVAYWSLEHILAWALGKSLSFEDVERKGLQSLPLDIRTHVALDDTTLSSLDGKLFQTAGFDLDTPAVEGGGWTKKRFGFIFVSPQSLKSDVATFGGERRLSYLKPVNTAKALQSVPQDIVDKIKQSKGFSLTFMSPAIFEQGYLPAWVNKDTLEGQVPNTGLKVKLKAVAIDRWIPVSGWDSVVWKPKATRKAISAGAVYWFEKLNEPTDVDLNQLWFTALSDHDQDEKDGFGSVICAPWN